FYTVYNGNSGLAEAQRDQQAYFAEGAAQGLPVKIPIIHVTLPATLNDQMTFSYSAGDQAVQ
ncbi:hypothetical protein, partial [Pseudomonas sp.]|uniref:hypothetical protein n=1 Tax=Pseudomonas sp. TaxID=306 RepID=UPI003CC671F0